MVGEIVARWDQTLDGYFGTQAATESAHHGIWFQPEDLVRRCEAEFLYVVNRRKDMFITGEENVYTREVEESIYVPPAFIGVPEGRNAPP